jgi:hypothetical protein
LISTINAITRLIVGEVSLCNTVKAILNILKNWSNSSNISASSTFKIDFSALDSFKSLSIPSKNTKKKLWK